MSHTKRHYSKKSRRTQRSRGGGRNIVAPYANGVDNKTPFANVMFSLPWFKDIPESNKGTLTGFTQTDGSTKVMMAKLTVNVSDANMQKFKIPGAIIVPEVKFGTQSGYQFGAYLEITASAIGRPDLKTVKYMAADNDYFATRFGGGSFGPTTVPSTGMKLPGLSMNTTK